ncbi:MAG: GtrA family protein [Lachnospiraceae bacterium]|jgi:glycosyltransferase involved in cell wall biosynthesis
MTQRIALIPAYEPDEHLTELVRETTEHGFDVVVVNDGSSEDKTPLFARAADLGAEVLTHEVNRGKGAALKTGLNWIREHCGGDYVVVTLDADGQHTVEDAIRVCETAEARRNHLILGSRSRDLSKKIPLRSRFGNSITRLVFRLTTGLKVYDTQTGLRAFDAQLAEQFASLEGDRYEFEMNMLLYCSRRKIAVEEIPIRTIYIDGNSSSHFDAVKDSFRIYREILKFAGSSFLGFVVDYTMFWILSLITGAVAPGAAAGVAVSNIGARVVSASVNFTVNRKLVFRSKANLWKSAAQYFTLAACILAGNTFLLNFMVNSAGINRYLAKIVTEITFFSISWLVQRFLIFRKKSRDMESPERVGNSVKLLHKDSAAAC